MSTAKVVEMAAEWQMVVSEQFLDYSSNSYAMHFAYFIAHKQSICETSVLYIFFFYLQASSCTIVQ